MQLVVIAKEPVPGRVKTRLCPPFSPEQAADLAAAALADTLETVIATPAARHTLVIDGEAGGWVPDGFDVVPQRGGGLDERLSAAFADCRAVCDEPVVLVGMDTPQMTSSLLLEAGELLRRPVGDVRGRRAVIGPALDGGYWLIGLSHIDGSAFAGVPMSASDTCRRQVDQLRSRRFEVRTVMRLRDIDTAADAFEVSSTVPRSRFAQCMVRQLNGPDHHAGVC